MEEIVIDCDCDEDVWFPTRPEGPKFVLNVRHVCCPERRKRALEEWAKRDEVGKRWLPSCPHGYGIEVPSTTE